MDRNYVTKIHPMRVDSLHADRQTDRHEDDGHDSKVCAGVRKMKGSETTEMKVK